MALFNCCFYKADYLSQFDAVHIYFKGEVMKDHIIKLRNMLDGLSESLKIEKLILDFTECDQVFIDYNSQARITFWRNLKGHGLSKILLIIPPKSFDNNTTACWKSFYRNTKLNIAVSAISDRKLMPYFIHDNSPRINLNK